MDTKKRPDREVVAVKKFRDRGEEINPGTHRTYAAGLAAELVNYKKAVYVEDYNGEFDEEEPAGKSAKKSGRPVLDPAV